MPRPMNGVMDLGAHLATSPLWPDSSVFCTWTVPRGRGVVHRAIVSPLRVIKSRLPSEVSELYKHNIKLLFFNINNFPKLMIFSATL